MRCLLSCFLALLAHTSSAANAGSKCVTLGADVLFLTTAVVAADSHLQDQYPEVQYGDDLGQPTGLEWVSKDLKTVSSNEVMARVGGKEIRRFVFWTDGGDKNGDGVVCVWLGIQTTMPEGGMGFRPFLVSQGGDQIRWWESYCAYDAKDGFTVVMEHCYKGTGVIWERAIVQLEEGGPVPLRSESGGRHRESPEVKPYRPAKTAP